MLTTLAYRIPRSALGEVLGDVAAYPLSREFGDAWQSLPGRRPRYRSLATALSAYGDRPVRLFAKSDLGDGEPDGDTRALLVTDEAFGPELAVAIRVWESRLRGDVQATRLAELVPPPGPRRLLADFIRFGDGAVPTAPNWVFRTAAWRVAEKLDHGFRVADDRTAGLRRDTEGTLLAWSPADLIADPRRTAFSMAVIRAALTTRPGVEDPILTFDGHLSKLMRNGGRSRNAWMLHAPDKPVLRLPLHWRSVDTDRGRIWSPYLDEDIMHLMSVLELRPIDVPESFNGQPGPFRPQAADNRYHPVGSGLGPRFMLRLHEHIMKHIPVLEPLTYSHDKRIKLATRVVKHPAGGIPEGDVATSGFDHVTVACVYSTALARRRMLGELKAMTGVAVDPEPDGPPVAVNARLSVVAVHAPDLLDHGFRNRAALMEPLGLGSTEPSARPDGDRRDGLTVAWVETEYRPEAPPEGPTDAKPHLRRILARCGVPSQFLASDPPVLPENVAPRSRDQLSHMTRAALRDLMRAAGIADPRVFRAVAGDRLPETLDRSALLVGIHTRGQTGGRDADGAVRVLTLCAMFVDPQQPEARRLLMFSERQQRWVRLGHGIADFHAEAIGTTEYGTPEQARGLLRERVEHRLGLLADLFGPEPSVVLFVNAQSARRIWPGLSNTNLHRGLMPGESLAAVGADVGVVRVNADAAEIGRPVSRTDRANRPGDSQQPAAPGRKVYRLEGTPEPVWYLPGRSVQSAAKGGDAASRFTRWSAQPDRKAWRTPWHSFTAAEFLVARTGRWRPQTLAALCARLSDQPLSWDGRTLAPVPLHLAITADKDHPDYRVSAVDEPADT